MELLRLFGEAGSERIHPHLRGAIRTGTSDHKRTGHRGVTRRLIDRICLPGEQAFVDLQPAGLQDLTIDNEYHVPFTTSLRFIFRNRETGDRLPPLLLWFSIAPMEDARVALHLRVSRGALKSPLADWLFKLIDELPLLEDATVVASVDPAQWSANRLEAGDEFVAAYRKAMRDNFPEILEWYVR